jgi:very-short-patch-repair endonuclease
MDIPTLRRLLRPFVGDLKDECTNPLIPECCTNLGLPVPEDVGSKRDRWHSAFDALDDKELPRFAQGLVDRRMLGPQLRNEVQDILWSDFPVIEIPKRHRRDIARALQPFDLFHHWDKFAQLLKDVFIVHDTRAWAYSLGAPDSDLEEIYRHFVRNPEDADVEWLFESLQAFDLTDKRFGVFLEGLASADVQVDMANQITMVTAMNAPLKACGAEMRQTGEVGGYPVFGMVSLRTPRGRPKNLIFASSRKPDIRFRDAVNNDIEIVSNPDDCLVYDKPLGIEGLRWKDLQQWWAETSKEKDQQRVKKALYYRLLFCLPESSPPQRLLFTSFYGAFGPAIPELPALLPEVWLYWDPKTVAQRGAQALLNHRMDFLLLLPGGSRVIIEVDGSQHYADEAGRADTRRYARLASGDRELKLAGYEVYRFGGSELQGPEAVSVVKEFFTALFIRHGIKVE